MSSSNKNIVTASGTSVFQRLVGAGGSGIKPGSNVAGPLRSSLNDRESTAVVSQAPVTWTSKSLEGKKKKARKIEIPQEVYAKEIVTLNRKNVKRRGQRYSPLGFKVLSFLKLKVLPLLRI